MTLIKTKQHSLRIDDSNPDHHIYRNNGGNWWIHYTAHNADHTAQRVRRSLQTRDRDEARERRDALLRALAMEGGMQ